jgi:regulator of replication initiation timing
MTQAQIATYRAALKEARAEWDRITKRLYDLSFESTQLNLEATKLRRTITALAAMCSEEPFIDKLGITDSCMEVMTTITTTATTNDVVRGLERMGFDIESQKNIAASVHSILSRLAKKGKIQKIQSEGSDAVEWRGPNYDPDFDRIVSEAQSALKP